MGHILTQSQSKIPNKTRKEMANIWCPKCGPHHLYISKPEIFCWHVLHLSVRMWATVKKNNRSPCDAVLAQYWTWRAVVRSLHLETHHVIPVYISPQNCLSDFQLGHMTCQVCLGLWFAIICIPDNLTRTRSLWVHKQDWAKQRKLSIVPKCRIWSDYERPQIWPQFHWVAELSFLTTRTLTAVFF